MNIYMSIYIYRYMAMYIYMAEHDIYIYIHTYIPVCHITMPHLVDVV